MTKTYHHFITLNAIKQYLKIHFINLGTEILYGLNASLYIR